MLDEVEIDGGDEGDSWFNWGGSLTGNLGSGAIFLLSLALLFWNETSSKAQADAYAEVGKQVQTVSATSVDPSLEGKPIHLSATVTSQNGAADSAFSLRTDGVAIYRHVRMYQWIEYKESHGRGKRKRTEYHYEMDWDWRYHDSSKFHEPRGHENPKPRLQSEAFFASDARLGAYRFNSLSVARQALWARDNEDPGSLGRWPKYRTSLPDLPQRMVDRGWFQNDADEYYLGDQSVEDVELGDLRVSFYDFPSNYPLSLIASQQGEQIEPWVASNGEKVLIARSGREDAKQMIAEAIARNSGAQSFLRLVGVIGAMLGMAGLAGAMGGLLSMIPLLGPLLNVSLRLVGALVGLLSGLLAIVLGWLWARPIIAIALLASIVGLIAWGLKQRSAQLQAQRRQARIAEVSQRARERAAAGTPPPPPTGAPSVAGAAAVGSATPPPAPPASAGVSAAAPSPVQPEAAEDVAADLPPLEWTPGLASLRPPSVRPRAAETSAKMPPPYGASSVDDLPARPLFEQVEARLAPAPQATAAEAEPTPPEAAKLIRRALGRKGEYLVNRILRIGADGIEQVVCFELMHAGKPLKRGTQAEIRQALLTLQTSGS